MSFIFAPFLFTALNLSLILWMLVVLSRPFRVSHFKSESFHFRPLSMFKSALNTHRESIHPWSGISKFFRRQHRKQLKQEKKNRGHEKQENVNEEWKGRKNERRRKKRILVVVVNGTENSPQFIEMYYI